MLCLASHLQRRGMPTHIQDTAGYFPYRVSHRAADVGDRHRLGELATDIPIHPAGIYSLGQLAVAVAAIPGSTSVPLYPHLVAGITSGEALGPLG